MTMSCVVTNMIETTATPHKDDPLGKAKQSSFPAGLRVLLVDDDPVCLMVIGQMLRHCQYEVCTCSAATKALDQLRDKSHNFDLVLSDVYMPDMDGFKLLEVVGLELGLPVIMMSANDEHTTVMRGVTHGACDFLIKPVRIEELKNIWQHVVRRSRHNATVVRDAESDDAPGDQDADSSRKRNMHSRDGSCNAEQQREEEGGANKKTRVVWSVEMHQQFVQAVNQLGVDKAVPKRILELMKVDGLTRENVASHLQKYRLYLKRVQQNAPTQGSNGGATAAAAAGGSGAFSSSMGLAAPGMVASNQMMWGNSKQLVDAMQAQQQAAAATVQQAAAGQQSLTLQQQQLMQQQQPPPQQQQQQVAQQQALAGQPGMGPDGMGNMLGLMPGCGLMSPVGQLLPGVNMGMGGMPGAAGDMAAGGAPPGCCLSGMGPMSGMSQPGAAAGGMMGLPGMPGAGFGGMMGFMPGMPGLPGAMPGMPGAMNPLGLSGMRAGMPGAPNDTSAVMAMMSTAANMQAAMFAQQAAAQQAAAAAALPTNSGGGSNGGVMPPLQPQSQPQQQAAAAAAALASPPASAGPAGLMGMAGAVKAEAAAMGGLAGMQGAAMAANGQRAAALQATAAAAAALAQQRVPPAGLQPPAGLMACSNNANGIPAAMSVPGQPAAATAAMNMHDYSNMFDDVLDVAGPTGGAAAAAAAAAQHAHGVDAAPDDYLIDFLLKGA